MGFSIGGSIGPLRVSTKGVGVGVSAGPVSVSGYRRWGRSHRAKGDGSIGFVGFCAVTGATLGGLSGGDDLYVAGFFWGIAIGVTLWVIVGAFIEGRNWGILAVATIGGMWTGYFVAGPHGIWPGFLYGAAVIVGWQVSNRILDAHVRSLSKAAADEDAAA